MEEDFSPNETGQWCAPPGLKLACKDPWVIKELAYAPNPLTEKVLGKKLEKIARKEATRLQGVDGLGTPPVRWLKTAKSQHVLPMMVIRADSQRLAYRYHRPNRDIEVIIRIESVFKLQAKQDASTIFEHFISNNIQVLGALQTACEEERQRLKKFMFDTIQMDSDLRSKPARVVVRRLVEYACRRQEEWEAWTEVLEMEMQMSKIALGRLKTASKAHELLELEAVRTLTSTEDDALKALFEEYRSWRGELARLVLKINEITGNGHFLKRHRYELWDIVDAPLLEG